jgi:hypothetical protein
VSSAGIPIQHDNTFHRFDILELVVVVTIVVMTGFDAWIAGIGRMSDESPLKFTARQQYAPATSAAFEANICSQPHHLPFVSTTCMRLP